MRREVVQSSQFLASGIQIFVEICLRTLMMPSTKWKEKEGQADMGGMKFPTRYKYQVGGKMCQDRIESPTRERRERASLFSIIALKKALQP